MFRVPVTNLWFAKRSRHFLILGLNADFEELDNPIPSHVCTWPLGTIKVAQLVSNEHREIWPRFLLEIGEIKPRSAREIKREAHRITSAIENLFTHAHHTSIGEFAPYQIPKLLAEETIKSDTLQHLDELIGKDSSY
jgi:hypothetical protein